LSACWLTSLVPVKRYHHVVKSDLKKLCKRRKNSLTVVKVCKNKFGQVEEKSFELVLCLFGFVKATKFRDSSECSD